MSYVVPSEVNRNNPTIGSDRYRFVPIVLAFWFAVVFWLAAHGRFVTAAGAPPFPILIAVLTPIAIFVTGYFMSGRLREVVATADLSLITSLHAMRFVGFAFLGFYALRILPGVFAWPAALGDMAIAATAPWMARALTVRPEFAASRRFIAWNLFGILDFVVAVGTGALVPFILRELSSTNGPTPFVSLPLSLIPTYLVPFYTILHLIALIRARHGA